MYMYVCIAAQLYKCYTVHTYIHIHRRTAEMSLTDSKKIFNYGLHSFDALEDESHGIQNTTHGVVERGRVARVRG